VAISASDAGPHRHPSQAARPARRATAQIAPCSAARPYAVRKPKQYAVSRRGDLVQVDILDVRPLPGVVSKQLTARDVISRWDVKPLPVPVDTIRRRRRMAFAA
jgi:hypothetical protein